MPKRPKGRARQAAVWRLMVDLWNWHSARRWAELKAPCLCVLCERARILSRFSDNEAIRLTDEDAKRRRAAGLRELRRAVRLTGAPPLREARP